MSGTVPITTTTPKPVNEHPVFASPAKENIPAQLFRSVATIYNISELLA